MYAPGVLANSAPGAVTLSRGVVGFAADISTGPSSGDRLPTSGRAWLDGAPRSPHVGNHPLAFPIRPFTLSCAAQWFRPWRCGSTVARRAGTPTRPAASRNCPRARSRPKPHCPHIDDETRAGGRPRGTPEGAVSVPGRRRAIHTMTPRALMPDYLPASSRSSASSSLHGPFQSRFDAAEACGPRNQWSMRSVWAEVNGWPFKTYGLISFMFGVGWDS